MPQVHARPDAHRRAAVVAGPADRQPPPRPLPAARRARPADRPGRGRGRRGVRRAARRAGGRGRRRAAVSCRPASAPAPSTRPCGPATLDALRGRPDPADGRGRRRRAPAGRGRHRRPGGRDARGPGRAGAVRRRARRRRRWVGGRRCGSWALSRCRCPTSSRRCRTRPTRPAWAERYAALAPLAETPEGREALGVLPVPLADGRVVRGARGPAARRRTRWRPTCSSGWPLPACAWCTRRAAHPLLGRLGALAGDAAAAARGRRPSTSWSRRRLTRTTRTRSPRRCWAWSARRSTRARSRGGRRPALARRPGAAGRRTTSSPRPRRWRCRARRPPRCSTRTRSAWSQRVSLERWGPSTLTAIGVLADFALVVADEVDLVDAAGGVRRAGRVRGVGAEAVGPRAGPSPASSPAVSDLDAVRPDAWAAAVLAMAGRRETRAALVDRVRVRDDRGRGSGRPVVHLVVAASRARPGRPARPVGGPGTGGPARPRTGVGGRARRRGTPRARRRAHGRRPRDRRPLPMVLDRLADPARAIELPALLPIWRLAGRAGRRRRDAARAGPGRDDRRGRGRRSRRCGRRG